MYLIVQGEECNRGVNIFTTLCSYTQNLATLRKMGRRRGGEIRSNNGKNNNTQTLHQNGYLETGAVYLFGQLIDGNIAGRAHEHGALPELDEMVHNGRRGHGFARAGRALDQAQGPLQGGLDSIDLRMVELRQASGGEPSRSDHTEGSGELPLRQCDLDNLRLEIVAK
jgi:hypothetical protein